MALGCALSIPAWTQTFGEITGQVRDQSGAALPQARITAVNTATNATRATVTTDAGVYSFPSLVPGSYAVRVEKEGFKAATTNLEYRFSRQCALILTYR